MGATLEKITYLTYFTYLTFVCSLLFSLLH